MKRINFGKAISAGLIAGAVFLIAEMILVGLFAGSVWGPPRMIAAILMGQEVLPPPATFELGMFLVAALVHFTLSVIFAIILAAIVHQMSAGTATLVGLGFGLALYLVNFYVFTGVFPWFANARNWITIVSHLLFGGLAAAAYKGMVTTPSTRRRYHHRTHPSHA